MKGLLLFLLMCSFCAFSQSTTITSGTQGNIQLPKLSYEQINAIPNPKAGMMAFDSTFKCLKYYNGTKWLCTTQTQGESSVQGFSWQYNFNISVYDSNGSSEVVNTITSDDQNNVYVAGITGFNPFYYGFVCKFSPNGVLLWKYVDSLMFTSGTKIKIDASKNVFVIMHYHERYNDSFRILKFSPNGDLEWGVNAYGSQREYISEDAIYIDNNQDLYITGNFSKNISIGPFSVADGGGCFAFKISNSGTPQWLKTLPIYLCKFKVNKIGDLYFAGSFSTYINVEGNAFYPSSSENILFGMYYSNGTLSWTKRSLGAGRHRVDSFTFDSNGSIYVSGNFTSNISLDGTIANSFDAEDFYVLKYSSNGVFSWIRNGGGVGSDKGIKIEVTSTDVPVALGIAGSKTLVFYPNIGLNAPTANNFLIMFNPNSGDIAWVRSAEYSSKLHVNNNGEIFTWENIQYTNPEVNIYSKFSSDGSMQYRKINGGHIAEMSFGPNNHFFFGGNFYNSVQIGTSILNSPSTTDLFVSHWME